MGARLWVFGVLFASAAIAGLATGKNPPGRFSVLFAVGLLTWTIVEYFLHRLAFHGFAPHTQHHAVPRDVGYTLAPLWLSLTSSSLLFGAFSLAIGSWTAGASILAGVIAGYLAYEAIHLRIHSVAPGGPLLRALRQYHFYHHYADDRVCFGVTSPIWDWVFRSVPADLQHRSRPAA